MKALLRFFVTRHYLCNFLFLGVFLCGAIAWKNIRKEELPEFESNAIRIAAPLSGATAQDVEELVTIPIEKRLKGLSGLESVESTSSIGMSSVTVYLDPSLEVFNESIQEIKDAVEKAEIPSETREDLSFHHFKTSEKSILDVGLYLSDNNIDDDDKRARLQQYALALENRLINLSEVSSVGKSAFLQKEIQVDISPQKLQQHFMPLQRIVQTLQNGHIVAPAGPLSDENETQVTLIARNETVEDIENLVVRGNDNSAVIRIKDLATVRKGFEKAKSILKVNGKTAIVLNIKKSSSSDIIRAQEAIAKEIEVFQNAMGKDKIRVVLMDDESYDVRNRIDLILSNGILGFGLILLVLFLFLDFKSGFWTAMGMPFSLAFTLLLAWLMGYSLNNVTLAAIILVLGIVVDDAIIISEHIARLKRSGMKSLEAAVTGTSDMLLPVLASILTTCAAFIPFFYFTGRIGNFVKFMPALIFAMLLASFFESIFILPGHLNLGKDRVKGTHWFDKCEKKYQSLLFRFLQRKYFVVTSFVLLLTISLAFGAKSLKFVLFPREAAQELFLELEADEMINRNEMAKRVAPIENIFFTKAQDNIVAVRTMIAQTRWGSEAKENRAFLRIELKNNEDRSLSTRELTELWEKELESFSGFKKKSFVQHRFGSDSGSPLEIEVRENNNLNREKISQSLYDYLNSLEEISNVEIDKPLRKKGLSLILKQQEAVLSNVDPTQLSGVARVFMEGSTVYSFLDHDEEVDVKLSLDPNSKKNTKMLGDLFVENRQENLLTFRRLLKFEESLEETSIVRTDYKRRTRVVADLHETSQATPLEIAEKARQEIFPKLQSDFPSSIIQFVGEVETSQKSASDLLLSSLLVLGLIYGILLLLYNSLSLPLLVMTVIPFGISGVICALFLHGQNQYGFFTVVGTLGMIGVVVNDSIVMLSRLEEERKGERYLSLIDASQCAASRIRAVLLTTLTTVAGLLPTAYGIFGFDSMLSEMMLAMAWGLMLGTLITLVFVPCLYACFYGRDPSKTK